MMTTREQSWQGGSDISVTLDPDRTLAVLAEARRMQARVAGTLALAVFTGPGKAISAVASMLRHPTGRPNYS